MSLATITLIVQILFYLVLCAGVVAQLRRAYKWHDRLQAPIVILNIFFILFVMIPTFRDVVIGNVPAGLSDVPTLVTATHGLLGLVAEGLAIYCLLAGFKILPRKIGGLRYWMWATFVAWTLTIFFGVGVYLVLHTGGDTSAETNVTEHDADLATQVEVVAPTPESTEPIAEHNEEEAEVEVVQEVVEEPIAEHDAEAVVEEDVVKAVTEEAVVEHDEEVLEEIIKEPIEEVVAEHDEEAIVNEHDAGAAEGAITDDGTDLMDGLIDEHAAETVVVEPEFTGETGFVAWEELFPTSLEGPGVRYEHGMQYSEVTDRVYLFGGRDGSQVYNDVWELDVDNVVWRRIAANSPVAPPARFSMVMMIDDSGQNIYIAAGHAQGEQNFNDIWKLDLTTETWQEITPTAGASPEPRYGNPGGNIGGNLVMTHGFGGVRYDDTWQFNVTSQQWENITPTGALPIKRCLFAGAPTGESEMVIHGGCAAPEGDCYLDDAWVLDTAANAWREVLTDVKPVGRQYHTMVDIPGRQRLIMYGGQDASRAPRDDLWFLHLDTGTWQLIVSDVKPPARYNHGAVWVPRLSGMVIYGGQNESGGLNDLWLGTF